ncbi:ABC transporter substrate-binding protein [Chromohalobacter sarecensis]|uniref:ABC transporter substrate-binding protein n=1 Tax=Chromohalobacter sarecensis TaxID=245294 RepID=A0ABV9CZB2_9GAMM|nr:ABC transporter substrate-binding protein [Chromohalobacter sarecensis]MCK0713565.1 ABC transporter substrate-binding protein [Chromohalobacter sarecensis]
MYKPLTTIVCAGMIAMASGTAIAEDKPLESVGISVGLLGNPFFVATIKGITDAAQDINPDVKITSVSADYDLNKQVNQIDNFIAAGVNIIMLNAVDDSAIAPAVQRAKNAGVTVAAFDVSAPGAEVTVMTDNVAAGREACQYIVDSLDGEGNVAIIKGPSSSSLNDRFKGCSEVFSQHDEINVVSNDQNGKGSRDGGMNVMQGLLTRYDDLDAVFGANDPMALGAQLAARQFNRNDIIITGVDGAPDTEKSLKSGNSLLKASASQDPYVMAAKAMDLAYQVFQGKSLEQDTVLIQPKLITADNVDDYVGWTGR